MYSTQREMSPRSPSRHGGPGASRPDSDQPKMVRAADILKMWNSTARKHGLPLTQRFNDQRGRAFRKFTRRRDAFKWEGALWKDYFKRIGRSPKLNGQNDEKFKATIDWALAGRNAARVLSGEYDAPATDSANASVQA